MTAHDLYDDAYFASLSSRVRPSVACVVPAILRSFAPSSAIDLGCGEGSWTIALAEAGVSVVGLDAALISRRSHPLATFLEGDLTGVPVGTLGPADICLCLEVAEHLPESAADPLIRLVCSCSNTVIFSAATPGQGGTGHLNEQPHEYWVARFKSLDFSADVSWRARFSAEASVAPWYRKNIIVFRRGLEES